MVTETVARGPTWRLCRWKFLEAGVKLRGSFSLGQVCLNPVSMRPLTLPPHPLVSPLWSRVLNVIFSTFTRR